MSNNFLEKLKQSATETGKKAQISIEINKMKSQIQVVEQEIQLTFSNIGKLVYSSFEDDNFAENENQIFSYCRDIASSKKDILSLELKIKELRDEKECPSCSATCSSQTKFCPECGHKFQIETVAPQVEADSTALKFCPGCGAENSPSAKFCGKCGQGIA